MTGALVAVEGPNGVGKTTVAALLAKHLREDGHRVLLTCEPTHSALGELVRSGEAGLSGRALALGVAADRHAHIRAEIGPALESGQFVVTDRYVQSSLVLQRLDGLSMAEIWEYNRHVPAPALSFYLEHDPRVIAERLTGRTLLSRLELAGSPARELSLYEDAHAFLDLHGWRQSVLDCRGRNPEEIVAGMIEQLRTADLLR